ncbi:hypothetical protein Dcar01_01586 [Deinococcus carri]|uniref:Peptidase S8/S53 domain-containing protein n=2 Tax=Deinococcus carri TaxID=1211323 RepID=A0ABP9W666_9DEIO
MAGGTGTTAVRPEFIAQVPLVSGMSADNLEAAYGGQVLSEARGEGYALMGFSASEVRGGLNAQGTRVVHVERNRDRFQGGGLTATMSATRSVWINGEFDTWANATRSVWINGSFNLVPQNTVTFQQIGLEAAQAKASNLGAGVKVAVVDTGVDIDHPAFAGSLAPQNEWRDFRDNDTNPDEEGVLGTGGYGHGTGVAGIVLQVAPKAIILPLRVLGPDGSGDVLHVAQAIDWAVKCNAQIINLSLGTDTRSNVVQDAINRATAKGVMVISAAGNDNRSSLNYPANDAMAGAAGDYSLSVGSVDAGDLKSSFSNYGKALEIVAPGEDVYTPGPDNLLVAWSGTSMAAPVVTGSLALALGQKWNISARDMIKGLTDNAADIYRNGMNSAYKDKLGKGRLDLTVFSKVQ